jgi:hypothetical protein
MDTGGSLAKQRYAAVLHVVTDRLQAFIAVESTPSNG